jgi:hypothetical protein
MKTRVSVEKKRSAAIAPRIGAGFIDNRPAATAQRELDEQSPQAVAQRALNERTADIHLASGQEASFAARSLARGAAGARPRAADDAN